MPSTHRQGFTVIELLVVIVVIAILAAISTVAYTGVQARAGGTVLKSDLRNAATQLVLDYTLNGVYPGSLEVANNNKGIPKSSSTTYDYISDGSSYCLTATSTGSGVPTYHISSDSSISEGSCPEHAGSETPAAPASLSVQKISGVYNASWNGVSGATSYTVQFSTTNNFSIIKGTQSGITDTNAFLCSVSQYDYIRVAALGAWGQTGWSSVVQATTGGGSAPC